MTENLRQDQNFLLDDLRDFFQIKGRGGGGGGGGGETNSKTSKD